MIEIKTASIRAACIFAATKDVRYYLIGVNILVRNDGRVSVRATDGTCAFEDVASELSSLIGANFIVSLDSAKLIAKSKSPSVTFALRDDGMWECAGVIFKPIDGAFPDTDRVVPTEFDASRHENYDFDLLAKAQKGLREAHVNRGKFFRLTNNKHKGGAGIVKSDGQEFPRVVVMPLRDSAFHD